MRSFWDPSRSFSREIFLHLEICLRFFQYYLLVFFLASDDFFRNSFSDIISLEIIFKRFLQNFYSDLSQCVVYGISQTFCNSSTHLMWDSSRKSSFSRNLFLNEIVLAFHWIFFWSLWNYWTRNFHSRSFMCFAHRRNQNMTPMTWREHSEQHPNASPHPPVFPLSSTQRRIRVGHFHTD